jgi:hypothetical protein
MCGIAGFVGEFVPGLVSRMNAIQKHRGPDGQGVFEDPEAQKSGTFPIFLTYGVLGGNLREGGSRNSGMAKPQKESSIFFWVGHISLLNLRGESSRRPPVLKLRRAGKAQVL